MHHKAVLYLLQIIMLNMVRKGGIIRP